MWGRPGAGRGGGREGLHRPLLQMAAEEGVESTPEVGFGPSVDKGVEEGVTHPQPRCRCAPPVVVPRRRRLPTHAAEREQQKVGQPEEDEHGHDCQHRHRGLELPSPNPLNHRQALTAAARPAGGHVVDLALASFPPLYGLGGLHRGFADRHGEGGLAPLPALRFGAPS